MQTRLITVELSPLELEVPIEWSYHFRAGRYSGRPEDCYPDEEECQIIPPKDIKAIILKSVEAQIKYWTREIENACEDLELENAPAEWAAELASDDGYREWEDDEDE